MIGCTLDGWMDGLNGMDGLGWDGLGWRVMNQWVLRQRGCTLRFKMTNLLISYENPSNSILLEFIRLPLTV